MKLTQVKIYSALFILIIAVLFQTIYRPWQMYWGAVDEEISRVMVGDNIIKNSDFNSTRAVTINASPERIWPWLIQIGYKKAGFYSYDFLDNNGIPSAERIIPEYQDLKAGDQIPLTKNSTIKVDSLERNKYLLLVTKTRNMTWSWGLYKISEQQTRLVSRLRVRMDNNFKKIFWDVFEIIMMRKHLQGIKKRAEREGIIN